jgi:ABC-type glutathione transport system ATPase component
MSSQAPDVQAAVVESAAATRGALTLAAEGLDKDFRLGRGHVLHAVRDVSLSLYRSAVVALVGESGSGKSTVARMLAGQEQPSGGIRARSSTCSRTRSPRSTRRTRSGTTSSGRCGCIAAG